jgi:hypothetical protein
MVKFCQVKFWFCFGYLVFTRCYINAVGRCNIGEDGKEWDDARDC